MTRLQRTPRVEREVVRMLDRRRGHAYVYPPEPPLLGEFAGVALKCEGTIVMCEAGRPNCGLSLVPTNYQSSARIPPEKVPDTVPFPSQVAGPGRMKSTTVCRPHPAGPGMRPAYFSLTRRWLLGTFIESARSSPG